MSWTVIFLIVEALIKLLMELFKSNQMGVTDIQARRADFYNSIDRKWWLGKRRNEAARLAFGYMLENAQRPEVMQAMSAAKDDSTAAELACAGVRQRVKAGMK